MGGPGHLADDLASSWPRGGPQWDALGQSTNGWVVLVEAKAYLAELAASCTAGALAKPFYGAPLAANWLTGYYQYANRLAHLKFVSDHGVPALLVGVYFCGGTDMHGPGSAEAWKSALALVYAHLGITGDLSHRGVVNVFIPVVAL